MFKYSEVHNWQGDSCVKQILVFAPTYKKGWSDNYTGRNAEAALARADTVSKSTDSYLYYAGCLKATDVQALREMKLPADKYQKQLRIISCNPGEGTPMLPPAHIEARAGRFTSKVFLSHLFDVMYKEHYGVDKAPDPYVVQFLNHTNWINDPHVRGTVAEDMTIEGFRTFDIPHPEAFTGFAAE